jgi:hypothetical protein
MTSDSAIINQTASARQAALFGDLKARCQYGLNGFGPAEIGSPFSRTTKFGGRFGARFIVHPIDRSKQNTPSHIHTN